MARLSSKQIELWKQCQLDFMAAIDKCIEYAKDDPVLLDKVSKEIYTIIKESNPYAIRKY